MLPFHRRTLLLLLLFGAVTGGFVLYRNSAICVWDDSPVMVPEQCSSWAEAADGWADARARFADDPRGELATLVNKAFSTVTDQGYRPLSQLQRELVPLGHRLSGPTLPYLLIYGTTYGALAVCLLLISRRFARHDATALLAVMLLFGSPPLAAASWLVAAGLQALVPLLICLALLLYWQAIEPGPGRPFYILALSAVLFVAPWFREFTGISPLLIGFLELRRARRPTLLMGLAGIFFLHAVFPTALVHWFFIPALPLLPVNQLGSLSEQMGVHGFRWEMAWQIVPLVPPLLLLLATCNGIRLGGQELLLGRPRNWQDWKTKGPAFFLRAVLPAAWCAALLTVGGLSFSDDRGIFGFVLCLGVAAIGLQVDLFLAVWFLLSFVPLMRVATESVHFLYALVPASIILACAAESLWAWVASQRGRWAWMRYAVALALAVVVTDQLLVIYGAYQVMQGQYAGMRAMAARLRQSIPAGSIVISNVTHGFEIQWAADGHYVNSCSTPWCKRHRDRTIDTGSKLDRLLADNHGKTKVFFLDCDFNYRPEKLGHHHTFVHDYSIDKRPLGEPLLVSAKYPFVDPLRYLIDRRNVPFLGPPDLENDFYNGRAINGQWFTNEVYCEYHLYEVTGMHAELVQLVLQGVHGFNINACCGRYYGVPQSTGAFDLEKARHRGYAVCFEGSSLAEVRRMIEAPLAPAGAKLIDPPVELVSQGVHGFNILSCDGRYYGVPQSTGAFDLKKARHGGYAVCFEGASLAEVTRMIEAPLAPAVAKLIDPPVELVLQGVYGFNILTCDGRYYGVPQSSGIFDLKKARDGGYAVCCEGSSIAEVRRMIKASLAPAVAERPASVTSAVTK